MNYVFYHIYCCPETINILKDQIAKIHFSSLYTAVSTIFCFLVGDPEYIQRCLKFIQTAGKKFKVVELGPNDETYERFTLLKIKDYITPEDKVLYIHTKGVTHNDSIQIYYWRTCMEYFLFTMHMECIKSLEDYDVAGIFYLRSEQKNINHFSGNMWWAKGSYILKLPDIIEDNYNCPEFYIGLGIPKVKNFIETNLNLYYDNFEFYRYCDST